MADILFKCPGCSKHLAVDKAAKGRTVRCVDCGRPVDVPQATIPFSCPACGWALSSSLSCAGDSFGCSNCGESFVVPGAAGEALIQEPDDREARSGSVRQQPGAGRRPLALRQDAPAASGGRPCPDCGSQIPRGCFQCQRCGYNTYTGRATPARSPVARPSEPDAAGFFMKCPSCGGQIPLTAQACGHCGRMLGCELQSTRGAGISIPSQQTTSSSASSPHFWIGAIMVIGAFLMLKAYFGGDGFLDFGKRASIAVEYAPPYTEDLTGCYSFRNWKKEVWGYSGVMRFHGWKTLGGHPHTIAIEFECRSSSGVILGQGNASFPDLYAGQSGRIELIGNGAGEADRITLRVGGTD